MSVQTICYYFRPIAGFINICPTALQASLIRDLKATVKHEVLHVLVSDFIKSGIYTHTCRTHTSLVRFINRYCACHSCTLTGVQLCAVCILERWVRESKNTEESFYQLTTHNRWWNFWIPKASIQHYIHLTLGALRGILKVYMFNFLSGMVYILCMQVCLGGGHYSPRNCHSWYLLWASQPKCRHLGHPSGCGERHALALVSCVYMQMMYILCNTNK